MYASSIHTSWFGARSVVACIVIVGCAASMLAMGQQNDGCKIECYPNTKVINGKGGVGKSENCRWILRTDGKPARLCDHIKCRKVCPNNQAASASQEQQEASASDNLHIEQQVGDENGQPEAPKTESMGIMRRLHGDKLSKAPVPGVAGGRLTPVASQPQQPAASGQTGGRRTAPTLPPSVEYDEKDTPPPISRFLDISPEE